MAVGASLTEGVNCGRCCSFSRWSSHLQSLEIIQL